jgi:flagellar hook-associated protein 2
VAISSSGLISGLKTDELITQLMNLEKQPITRLQNRQKEYQTKMAAVLELKTKLANFQSAVESLNGATKFNTRVASVTNTAGGDALLSATAESGASSGSYSVQVLQLAQAHIIAAQGWEDQNTTAISSVGGSFKFKVGSAGAVKSIGVTSSMTLQGLRDAINAAAAGVSASIVNDGTGTNPYRLVLTGASTGSDNTTYITQNDTDLDFENKQIETAYANTTNDYSGNVYSNSGAFYTGTDNKSFMVKITRAGATTGALADRAKYKYSTDGGITWSNEVAVSTGGADATADIVIDATNKTLYRNGGAITLAEGTYTGAGLATELETKLGAGYSVSYDSATRKFTIANSTGGAVTFNWSNTGATAAGVLGYDTIDSTVANASTAVSDFDAGGFIDNTGVANSTNGRVKIAFGTAGTLVLDDKFSVDAFNPEMQTAQDAVIKIGNSTIVKSSNTVDDAIEGVTMNLLKVDASSTVTLSVNRDTSEVKTSISEFVDAYNTLNDFLETQLSYNSETKTANPLLGDSTVLEIRNKISRAVSGWIPGLGTSSYTSLSQIGIWSNRETGELSIDESAVAAALAHDPDAVARLFIGTATATNGSVSFVSKSSNTQPGKYSVSVATAPEKATLLGAQTISTAGISAAERLTFLFSDDKTKSEPAYTTFSVSLSAGATANSIVNSLNSAFATNDVNMTATNEGGQIRITSTEYGADQFLRITSDKGNVAGQIGFNNDGSSADAGVDIVGSINNHRAKGVGNQLTATSGFSEDGLVITVDSSDTGGLGTISISSGIADRLPTSLGTYTATTTGILDSKESSMQKSIDALQAQIDRIEERLTEKEESLRQRFARLETLLGQYNSTSDYLSSQLANLTKITSSSK